jgi:hypothetical protein
MSDDLWFERIADAVVPTPERASARLTSKVYSALVQSMSKSRALLDLVETKQAGGRLCVFEKALAVLPLGEGIRSTNPCRICHARVLGETLEHAPIFWPGCPYSEFHNG